MSFARLAGLAALVLAAAAAALALLGGAPVAAFAGGACALLLLPLLRAPAFGIVADRDEDPSLRRVTERVSEARRLAIYERETGLLARWYFGLRGQEECLRAGRYDHDLSLLLVAAPAGTWTVEGQFADWLQRHTRSTDLCTHLGGGRYLLLLPETGAAGARALLSRMQAQAVPVEGAIGCYRMDGETLEELQQAAEQRLSPEPEPETEPAAASPDDAS